jgi:hypothetical protein
MKLLEPAAEFGELGTNKLLRRTVEVCQTTHKCVDYQLIITLKQEQKCIFLQTWVRVLTGAGNFSFLHRLQTGSEAHSVSYPTGTEAVSLRVKWPGSETGHSLSSGAKVKNAWR